LTTLGSLAQAISTKIFFVAKIPDSELAQAAFHLTPSVATTLRALLVRHERLREMPAVKAFPATSISSMILRPRRRRVLGGFVRRRMSRTASLFRAAACQHFFKPDAVFFGALVYSRRSASRFPNARSD
jgi:hypothetical protein